MKNWSDSAEQPVHDREDCKRNADTDDSDAWRYWTHFPHADIWAELMREPSASPVSEDSESDWWADSSAEQLARHSSDAQKDQLMRETSASPVSEATKSDWRTDSSAEQPARHSSDAQSSMTALVTHNPASSFDQPAVLQCLDRGGWLVTPLGNGCRVVSLSRVCKQALEGWPNRLECFEFEEIAGTAEVARKVQWLAHHCHKLRYLALDITFSSFSSDGNIALDYGVMSEAIEAVATGCPELRHLDLSGNDISDAAIKSVVLACPQLECLHLLACDITGEALWAVALVQRCHWWSWLKELNVACNPDVSNPAIQAVAEACPQLQLLNMNHCLNLSDEAIVSVAWCCPELKELYVSALHSLTDVAIQAVAQGCPQLKALNVSACALLTDAAIGSLVRGCVQLEWLNARNCRLLTFATVEGLEWGCLRLTYLDMSPLILSDNIPALRNFLRDS